MGASAAFFEMQRKSARALCAGILATLALIAVLCVVDNEVAHESHHKEHKDLRGNSLLKEQANRLNAERAAKKKGKDMQSFDDMLHKFQHQPDSGLTATLVHKAPKKSSFDVALSPQALGIAPTTSLPSINQLNFAPKKKHAGEDKLAFAADVNFVQEYSEEWKPSGQSGLDMQIKSAQQDDEKEELKADGITGSSILGAAGVTRENKLDAMDILFLQESASDDTGSVWVPKGQSTLSSQLKTAHQQENAARQKNDAAEFKGHSILSSVGITKDSDDDDDWVPAISNSDLMLAQVSADWVPGGQSGLTAAIKTASISDEADAVKADGLGGTDILSASRPAPESEFLQHDDKVLNWHPHGQFIKGAHKGHAGVHHLHKTKHTVLHAAVKKAKKQHAWLKNHDLDGDDILSAVSLGHHRRTGAADSISSAKFAKGEFDAFALLKD